MKQVTFDPAKDLTLYFRCNRAGSKNFIFTYTDGTAYSFVYDELELHIYKNQGAKKKVISLTHIQGITLNSNTVTVAITKDQSNITEGEYYWELYRKDLEKTWLCGDAIFHSGKFDGVDESTETITIDIDGDDINITVQDTINIAAVPDASPTVKGIAKLYTDLLSSNTDGAVDQSAVKAVTDLKAPLASPALTGTPTAPTAILGTNTTQLATTEFVQAAKALKIGIYSTELTFDTNKDIYQDVTTPTFTLAASGNINGIGIILRLNTPTSVTFPANFEASSNSATLDATKLNVYMLVYFSNWNGSGTARVIYTNSLFTAIGTPASWSPSDLGLKLKGWYEVDGLVANSTTANGITASNGDVSQLSDLSGNSNHFTLNTNPPNFDGTKLNFVSESTESLISAALMSAIASDTQGEMVFVFRKSAGVNTFPICFSRLADVEKRCYFGIINDTDKIFAQFKTSGTDFNLLTGVKVFSDTQFMTLSVSSNGLAYKLFYEINGERIQESFIASNGGAGDDGDWVSDIVPGNISLFSLVDSSPIYYSGSLYAFLYCSQQLTAQERSDLFCYLNNKYQVWP